MRSIIKFLIAIACGATVVAAAVPLAQYTWSYDPPLGPIASGFIVLTAVAGGVMVFMLLWARKVKR